jgi:hypothetical protein
MIRLDRDPSFVPMCPHVSPMFWGHIIVIDKQIPHSVPIFPMNSEHTPPRFPKAPCNCALSSKAKRRSNIRLFSQVGMGQQDGETGDKVLLYEGNRLNKPKSVADVSPKKVGTHGDKAHTFLGTCAPTREGCVDMTPRTATLPATDRRMWRKLLRRCHPDAGGDHELCIWAQELREILAKSILTQTPPGAPPTDERPRVPFVAPHDFEELTRTALRYACQNAGSVYGELLSMLVDCHSLPTMWFEEQRGASYRRLAAIGHRVGTNLEERREWYALADSIPLSDRHAGHILSRLKGKAAA